MCPSIDNAVNHDCEADFVAAQAMVGRPYVVGEFDCAHLYLQVQKEIFGRSLVLPTQYSKHAKGRTGQGTQICAARDELARQINAPIHGCAVLLVSPDSNGQRWHIGTIFSRSSDWWVLHNSSVMGGVSFTRLRDFAWRGQRIEGFYEWK